ncbi:hypothetical protein C5167_035674 [Papaver somniferum]|uniref:Pectinesterase n=1 Tax=Papaver somniferum TaxID=3469 RepID=A0A4Y7KK09_PAPSO|nr:hypothetical protein C5167_035674 [Papaver somniferum]
MARVIKVSQDGSGDYKTVQEAVDCIPLRNAARIIIQISPGIYKQPIYIPKTKNFITFSSSHPEDTILTCDNTATKINHHQGSRLIGTGTFGCGSVIVEGEDFIAENVTFENNAPQGSGQAVALRVTAERCAFYNCRFLGWQDTLYLHYGKHYLKDCYIEGSVDFIFGNSTALLEHCHIHCKAQGYITAQGRKSADEPTGYVFLRVVFAYTYIDDCIKHEGWHNWGKCENERSACFYEYRCFGPGCCPSKRVNWARELMKEEAQQFLMHQFVDPSWEKPWMAQRMGLKIPYSA